MGDAHEKYLKKYGDSMRSSLGVGRTPDVPAGMVAPAVAPATRAAGTAADRGALSIELDRIIPDPEQPRREFDEEALDRLANSLKARGQLQNAVVFWSDEAGTYVLVSGERRWRAARRAGLPALRCKVLERRPDDAERLAVQMIENCVREDLRPVERARAFRRLIDATGWSHERLAAELNVTQVTVSTSLKLLELPEAIRDHVEAGELPPTVAYELSKLDDAQAQVSLADRVVAEGLTRGDVVAEVQSRKAERPRSRGAASKPAARGKGRGPRLVTKRVFKAAGGRATVERAKGVDSDFLRAIAEEILASLAGHGEAPATDDPASEVPGPRLEPTDPNEHDDEQGKGVAA